MPLRLLITIGLLLTPFLSHADEEADRRRALRAINRLYDAVADSEGLDYRDIRQKINKLAKSLDLDSDQPSSSSVFICMPQGSTVYIQNLKTGQLLGSNTTPDICHTLINNSDNGLICTPLGSTYYVQEIATGKLIGVNVPLQTCLDVVASANSDLLCMPIGGNTFYLHKRADGTLLGTNTSFQNCSANIK